MWLNHNAFCFVISQCEKCNKYHKKKICKIKGYSNEWNAVTVKILHQSTQKIKLNITIQFNGMWWNA
jgi:recombinational DNA repair protein RecR